MVLWGQDKKKIFLYSIIFVFVLVGSEGLLRSVCLFSCLVFLGAEGYYACRKYDGKYCWIVYLLLLGLGLASQTFFSKTIVYGGIIILLMFLGFLFLYLTCYPCTSLKSIALWNWMGDVVFLSVWNTGGYFFGKKRSAAEWNQGIRRTAGLTIAAIVMIVLVVMGMQADSVFSLIVYCFLTFLQENLHMALLVGLFGFCYSVALYNFITGLDNGILKDNPHWYYKATGNLEEKKSNFTLEVLLSDKTVNGLLCIVSVFNVILFLCRVINILHEDDLMQAFTYKEQFYVLLAILGVEAGLLYIIRMKLMMDGTQALEIHWTLAMVSSISCILPWLLASTIYMIEIYMKLISPRRSAGLYVLAVIFLYLNAYRGSCKKAGRTTESGMFTSRTVLALLVVVLVWNSALFPFYNVNLYEMKYDRKEIMDIDPVELNIEQMAKSGKYAIPVLIRLLEWDMLYGHEGKTVSQVAEEHLLQIYYHDMDRENVNEIMEQTEEGRLEMLLKFMDEEFDYRIGFMGYCRRKLGEVVLRRSIE